MTSLNSFEDFLNGQYHPVELAPFASQLFTARRRQCVITSTPIVFGRTPLRLDPSVEQQALQSWIKRTLSHLQDLVGNGFQVFGDCITVLRTVRQRSQNQ